MTKCDTFGVVVDVNVNMLCEIMCAIQYVSGSRRKHSFYIGNFGKQ